ncbi:MAG: FG-GAP-like repeat-containing protein, partial [Thermoanaerobaculia bacterium]
VQAFILDGTVATSNWTGVNSPSLGEKRLAVLGPDTFHPGMHGGRGDRELFANLGDPLPANGVRDQLIVSSGLNDENRPGGFVAHLLTERSGGGFTAKEVAASVSLRGLFIQDVAALPDVDGDGVRDVALFEPDFADDGGDQVGRVRVLSGAGLLDGFSIEDVIQEVHGGKRRFFSSGMRALGDQDRDGLEELLVTGHDAREGYTFAQIYAIVPPGGARPDCNLNGVPDDLDLKAGDLAFAPGEPHAVGDFPREVVVADLNGDGRQDLAVAGYRSKDVSVLLNEGGGGFSTAARFAVENGPWSVAATDLDRDGDLDLATANFGTEIPGVGTDFGTTVSLLLNDGRGVFRSGGDLQVAPGPTSVRAGDFDR